ncbi:MAG: hypothetical protein J6O04_03895 [Selenomonadaceae bacterium]|nr:hypothetical protein [Selenomonadaceae bacterium]
MGFFGDLWDIAKSAAAIAVGAPIALGAWAADKAGIIDLSGDVGKTEAIDENSSAQEINDSAELLEKMRSVYRRDGENIEESIQERISIFFDDWIDHLEDDDDFAAYYDISALRREQRRLVRDIRGSLTRPVSIRISMDDSECMSILSMSPGSQKEKKMDRFCKEVIRDAREDLESKIEDVLYRQTDEITNIMREYVERKASAADRKKKEFEKMEKDMESNTFNAEEAQLNPKAKIFALEEIKKILAA